MQITIHIGFPKCASSTLQAYFADNAAFHRGHGLLYPDAHRQPKGYRSHRPLLEPDLDPSRAVAEILEEARQAGCDRILLSAEDFSTDRSGRLQALTDGFRAQVPEASVTLVCLLRDPVEMLRSSYFQFIRGGLWGIDRPAFYRRPDISINGYIEAFHASRGCHWYEYDTLLNAALKEVRADRLYVRATDAETGVLDQVRAILALPEGTVSPDQNTRHSARTIKLLRSFQRDFGEALYVRNRKVLLRRVDLSGPDYSEAEAVRDGMDLPRDELLARYPDMEAHRRAALAMERAPEGA